MKNNPHDLNQTIDLSSGVKKTGETGFVFNNSVQFSDSRLSHNNNYSNSFRGGVLARLVIKFSGGKIKTANQAQLVLLGVMAMAIVVTLTMVFKGGEEFKQPFGGGSNPQFFK